MTILIVDDDVTIRETLQELLSASYECHTADRAEQAFAYLKDQTYETVVTDVSMPGLSGRELLSYIQAMHCNTPVIVISGKSTRVDAQDMLNAGAYAYFPKPFKLEQIEDSVSRAVARFHELQQTQPPKGEGETKQQPEEIAIDAEEAGLE
jgi:two-component system response regulator FlrC